MISLFEKYLTKEWRDFVNFHCTKVICKKGDFIFDIGEETKGLFIIDTGKVKIQTKTPTDKVRIVRLASDGDVIGHRGFGGSWKYSIAAIALEETELVFMPIEIFNQAVKSNPDFGFFMMMFFAEELRDSESLANQCPVVNRVAQAIYKNYKTFGLDKNTKKLNYTISRKDFASMVGTTYESVVRSIAELDKEKVIQIDGKSICVIDVNKLKQLSVPI